MTYSMILLHRPISSHPGFPRSALASLCATGGALGTTLLEREMGFAAAQGDGKGAAIHWEWGNGSEQDTVVNLLPCHGVHTDPAAKGMVCEP